MLFDDVREALPGLRAQAESLMVDECTISWQSGKPVLNEDTGQLESPSATVGPFNCQVLMPGRDAREGERGAHEYVQGVGELKLPVTVTETIPAGAVAKITSSSAIPDGTELRIVFERTRTLSTARRFAVEVTSWRE